MPDFESYCRAQRAPQVMIDRAAEFLSTARERRTIRDFKPDPVPDDVVADCLKCAMTAPSGANQQPWKFVWVRSPDIRKKLREAAETEEREFYGGRAPSEWLNAVEPFGTDWEKPFLETAPVLIAVFAESWQECDGERKKNYYVSESVGIATGFLIAALNHAGLSSLTHTPSPMKFLNGILQLPENERPYLLLAAGHATDDCQVPAITKKSFDEAVISV